MPFVMAFAFAGLSMYRAGLGVVLTMTLVGTALMFVVYYTMVTSLVARREQLVLKRLLAGEPTPLEILLAPAVPRWALFVVQSLVAVGGAILLGASVAQPWALALAVIGGATTWTALAIWSATWTRTVESAQLTTLPFILISLLLSGFSLPLSLLPGVRPGHRALAAHDSGRRSDQSGLRRRGDRRHGPGLARPHPGHARHAAASGVVDWIRRLAGPAQLPLGSPQLISEGRLPAPPLGNNRCPLGRPVDDYPDLRGGP